MASSICDSDDKFVIFQTTLNRHAININNWVISAVKHQSWHFDLRNQVKATGLVIVLMDRGARFIKPNVYLVGEMYIKMLPIICLFQLFVIEVELFAKVLVEPLFTLRETHLALGEVLFASPSFAASAEICVENAYSEILFDNFAAH